MADTAVETPPQAPEPPAGPRPLADMVRELPRFSPAAVMLAQHSPSKALMALPSVVLALVAVLAGWAWLSVVDIVTTAPGHVVPSARVKVVQPLEPGVVRRIHVREGETVRAGTPVVDLDPTETRADRERLTGELAAARAEAARLGAMLEALDAPRPGPLELAYPAPSGVAEDVADRQARLLAGQWRRVRTQREVAARERARLSAQLESNRAQRAKAEAVLSVLRERVAIRAELHGKELVPKAQLLELRQTEVEQEQELTVLAVNARQTEADLASALAREAQQEEELRERLLGELAEKERAIDSLVPELRKAEERASRRTLLAPVDGVVVDLAIHTVGGVVREAEPLLRVVPEDEKLEVEAAVKTREIGFVREGQAVEVKVDTFPYTRYGTIRGRIAWVAADASGQDPANAVYKVRVLLERQSMRVDGAEVLLSPGMSVTVDVKTGTRRVIDYLLEPVLKYRAEAMRDR